MTPMRTASMGAEGLPSPVPSSRPLCLHPSRAKRTLRPDPGPLEGPPSGSCAAGGTFGPKDSLG